ncbi:MAG: CBS domain-containing protein [Anaerolineales bacterium]|nr:CBS domain-containing protein [Anaerolineales bacterium]
MRIILTHEQTDFDGLASLFGAHLIDETAIAVLPRRLNRNVRAFLTLYGVELPFVDPRDLPGRPIESVTLVDTQSLTSIKGMYSGTRIQVIDHHKRRSDLPEDWQVQLDQTGANTTIFVEAIQEQDLPLTVVQASLLLLGIYEDTGSLTYTRTTARDMRAAAYLLERGASLVITNDYTNHPLSLKQQAIYDRLRQTAEYLDIHGHTVILASEDARGLDEELSTVAHKLRDLLDPDAILLLVSIRGGLQLIARSTSDQIDVAQIATHFGGGGHPRAAAALIKDRPLDEIYEEVKQILPAVVQPAITVAEIMSATPQVLEPDTTAKKAAERMQRYGYEGYPVVSAGKILGLLTRRAVDRAISHQLNLNAESLMEAGNYHVHPDHSIEHLQNLMVDSGWGQIPVVDRETHAIIGIVTRTDLLKTLAPKTTSPGTRNLADRLEKALPKTWLALLRAIAELALQQRLALYIVGGFVRDLLLEHPGLDFDLVVEGDAISLAKAVQERFGGRINTHKRFGTAKWHLVADSWPFENHQPTRLSTLDFISARTEFYTHPTALPTVERGSIKLDLHRRDFTINTLALRLDGHHYGELHDYWGGYNDLRHGLVRVLHSLSFVDDPTRMLRAVRYEQRYDFEIGKRTLQLLVEAKPLIDRVSGDRIRHELDNILAEKNAAAMLERLDALGLLQAIHPDLSWDDWLRQYLIHPTPPTEDWGVGPDLKGLPLERALAYLFWLVRLPPGRAHSAGKRLRLGSSLRTVIDDAHQLWQWRANLTTAHPNEISEYLDQVAPLAIYAVHKMLADITSQAILATYNREWRHITTSIDGHDLRALGVPPGPIYSRVLKDLRAGWINGEITTPEQEKTRLVELLGEDRSD